MIEEPCPDCEEFERRQTQKLPSADYREAPHHNCFDCGAQTSDNVYSHYPVFCQKCVSSQKFEDALAELVRQATSAVETLEAAGYPYSSGALQLALDKLNGLRG